MAISRLVAVSLFLLCISREVPAAESVTEQDHWAPDLTALTYPDGDEAVNELVRKYDSTIRILHWRLEVGGLTNEQQVYGIYLLGQLRDERSIPILIKVIDVEARRIDPKFGAMARWGKHPAVEALGRFREPAARQILEELKTEKHPGRRKLMIDVIRIVHGEDAARALLDNRFAGAYAR